MKRFRLSEIQAQAILDMQLRRLAALERKKIEEEYKAIQVQIKALEALLKSPKKMRELCSEELGQVKELYGDRRRTFITGATAGGARGTEPIQTASLTPDHTVWVCVTAEGLISRTIDEKPPRISGTAAPKFLVQTNSRDVLYLAAENGETAGVPVHALPEAENPADGNPYHKVSALTENDKLAVLFTLPPKEERPEGRCVFTCTRQGMVKKSDTAEMPGPTAHPFTLVKVNEGDTLGWVRLTDGKSDVLLATADGMAIRFSEEDVRPMGLVAAGVGGIKLGTRDEVIGMESYLPRARCCWWPQMVKPSVARQRYSQTRALRSRRGCLEAAAHSYIGRSCSGQTFNPRHSAPDQAGSQGHAPRRSPPTDTALPPASWWWMPRMCRWLVDHPLGSTAFGGWGSGPASSKGEAEDKPVREPASKVEAEQLTFGLDSASSALTAKTPNRKVPSIKNHPRKTED